MLEGCAIRNFVENADDGGVFAILLRSTYLYELEYVRCNYIGWIDS